jgi:hypothetical protein
MARRGWKRRRSYFLVVVDVVLKMDVDEFAINTPGFTSTAFGTITFF